MSLEDYENFVYGAGLLDDPDPVARWCEFGETQQQKTAKKNEEALTALLEADAGSRFLGELGIGTGPNIIRYTRSMLFDEKIKGSFHLAVGHSYPETGGTSEAAIHGDFEI